MGEIQVRLQQLETGNIKSGFNFSDIIGNDDITLIQQKSEEKHSINVHDLFADNSAEKLAKS